MEYRSISIGERVFHALMEIKRPTEDVSELIDRLIDQDAKHSEYVEQYEDLSRLFKLYLPENTITESLSRKGSLLHRENRVLTIMFSDIRSFTGISEAMSLEDIIQFLDGYFRIMTEIIYTRGGIVDKFIGDAIMAYFGYPIYEDKTTLEAVLAAIEMVETAQKNGIELERGSVFKYNIGIGINLGLVTIGNIGNIHRKLDFTVIGDMVNLASRLEGLTKVYGQDILVSESVQNKIKDVLPSRIVDAVAVKKISEPVRIFTTRRDLDQKEREAWKNHNEGMTHLFAHEFENALRHFHKVLEYQENDQLARMMIERCTKTMQK